MDDATLDALPTSLRETIRATLAREPARGRDVRSTIEPASRANAPALEDAIALLSRLGLLKDPEAESRDAYELIRSRLGNVRAL